MEFQFDLNGRWRIHVSVVLNQNPFSRRDLIKKAAGTGLGLIAAHSLPGRTKVNDAGNSKIDSWCEQLVKHKIEKIERRRPHVFGGRPPASPARGLVHDAHQHAPVH